ncbi:MAG: hypothetical protein R2882_11625 [Gemmatimonadales bacterium]
MIGCAAPAPPPPLAHWSVSPTPTITIAGGDSTTGPLLQVRGAWRLSDGAIAVADGGSNGIRRFASGQPPGFIGGRGDGPGEIRQLSWTGHLGDTAVVFDGALRRLTLFALGREPRMLSILRVLPSDERGRDFGAIVGRLSDGRRLVHAMTRPDPARPGRQFIPGFVGLLAPDATGPVDWLAEVADMAVVIVPDGSGTMVNIVPAAFPTSLAVVATPSAVWYGNTGADTIVRFDADLAARTTVVLPDQPRRCLRDACGWGPDRRPR